MLNFAEEVMLLMLEDENGRFAHVPELCMRCVLGGAVLMELAMKDRIDTDLEKLVVINPQPTGDDLLDPTLKHIVESKKTATRDIGLNSALAKPTTFGEQRLTDLSPRAYCAGKTTDSFGFSDRGATR